MQRLPSRHSHSTVESPGREKEEVLKDSAIRVECLTRRVARQLIREVVAIWLSVALEAQVNAGAAVARELGGSVAWS